MLFDQFFQIKNAILVKIYENYLCKIFISEWFLVFFVVLKELKKITTIWWTKSNV